jgi:DNA-binding response OmpR family regulator
MMITVDILFNDGDELSELFKSSFKQSIQTNVLHHLPEGNVTGNEFMIFEFDDELTDIDIIKLIDGYQHVLAILSNDELLKYKYLIRSYGIDFIVKPYSNEELCMRIENHLLKHNNNDDVTVYKKIKIFNKKNKVYIQDKLINLSQLEYNILNYFITNRNSLVTKEKLITDVWKDDPGSFKLDKIRVAIFRLKNKLAVGEAKDYIQAKPGFGYYIN